MFIAISVIWCIGGFFLGFSEIKRGLELKIQKNFGDFLGACFLAALSSPFMPAVEILHVIWRTFIRKRGA